MFFSRASILLASLWAGSLWTIGYIAAPTLFATLSDRALAGTIAGSLFRVQAWVSIGCAVLLGLLVVRSVASDAKARKQLFWVIGAMLACTCLMQFGIHPLIAALRETAAATGGVMEPDVKARFGILHGVSSGLYLLESLLAVALVWKVR